jgi:flagellar motor switch protein FliN/FliY
MAEQVAGPATDSPKSDSISAATDPAVAAAAVNTADADAGVPTADSAAAASSSAPSSSAGTPGAPELDEQAAPNIDPSAIDELLKQASFEGPAPSADAVADDVQSLSLPSLTQVMQDAQVSSIDLLRDVELNVKIELGGSRMLVEDVLKLSEGSVVELDKLAGDPVDVFVNERLVARGEVLVLNDNFCVRINEIIAGIREEAT